VERIPWGKVANTKETSVRLLTLPFKLVVVLLKPLVLLVAVVALLFLGRRNRG